MYISKIQINNFRNFKEKEIEFNDGVNVIIGHNNAGKTNLIKALSLVIDTQNHKRLDADDFNKNLTLVELKANPPKITIAITIEKGKEQEPDDLVTISNWLTKLDSAYEALLTYEFFLPEKKHEDYITEVSAVSDDDEKAIDKVWKIIKHDFIRFYTYKIWGGDTINQSIADNESLSKFDFQFLNAIRDVERDMLTGRNTLLREVFDFFMDYEIKKDPVKTNEQKHLEIKGKKIQFSEKADMLIKELSERIDAGKKEILSYAKNTGASFNKAIPNFEGSISENEMYSVLKLIVEYETGIKIPATHNGLGYNNLIFMSLLLAKMQVNADVEYLDANAKVFNTLAIEEPEAHLHPAMQYKFLKFLNENMKEKKVRQIFVTTHSTHITSAVSLDEIICLHNEEGNTTIGYPKKVFIEPDGSENIKSKKYVQRFLDATKSDMLFAQKIILVEGIAEQLLISIFANYLEKSLEDHHVAIINVGGRYFNHFLYLFNSVQNFTLPKKVICLTDRDPERKEKPEGKFKKCYPFEFNHDTANYEYQTNPTADLFEIGTHPNITFYSQPIGTGKTFEYEILLSNPSLDILITESISNAKEITELMTLYSADGKTVQDLLDKLSDSTENQRIKNGILANTSMSDEEKKKAVIASRYLNSVGKGENALELCYALQENLSKKGTPDFKDFNVPPYIKSAIEELCQ
ncbi:ATP-dependent nuclease [Elizabethkingia anophelis]|uniref:ATP-dependent nuclease n=1 Tax=Bacteroidota TaxID=976 RepID=UPI0024E1CE73|nr:AAA family ATPase [Elizabethkingia anophelis]MDV3875092.1 ATP-dependent endonuclease [Elizabethkingia anophelis]CAH1141047.1 DNA replication and repair protein RecF [Elizabethkingia anophelis]CAI9685539.1 DNA replication and repair protein RecF [Elizabethkingia anophelis]